LPAIKRSSFRVAKSTKNVDSRVEMKKYTGFIHLLAIVTFGASASFAQASSVLISNVDSTPKLLDTLNITPSKESVDYVNNKKQFQLNSLLTEQRHPKTWNLSYKAQTKPAEALKMLFAVDEDITRKFSALEENPRELEQASNSIQTALKNKNKIYVYGCGATGRLSKQIESSFWRPFWRKLKKSPSWGKVKTIYPDGEDELIGEMTGGDRGLISSIPGFEDLQLIGRLQLQDRGIQRGDVVFAITEGGETSSVIGTILSAVNQYGLGSATTQKEALEHLYFIYNNPDEVLAPFERSQSVIQNPAITKIRLFTGPQSVAGSTRMQATTSEMFVMGVILENALYHALKPFLTVKELKELGFNSNRKLKDRLQDFKIVQNEVAKIYKDVARLTTLEAKTYNSGHYSTYFAKDGLITVFTDSTERAPTFHLLSLDTVKEQKRKSLIQVWTEAKNRDEAWNHFLGRKFRGLDSKFYEEPFKTEIEDPFLKEASLKGLQDTGNDQQLLYDFSFSEENKKLRGPQKNDLGILILMPHEVDDLLDTNSSSYQFLKYFSQRRSNLGVLFIENANEKTVEQKIKKLYPKAVVVQVHIEVPDDPINLRENIAAKLVLNAHSTATMARLGKVVSNTMTSVNPSNLKLIGRATYLIESHINDVLNQPQWTKNYGITEPVTYEEANAVLFDAINYVKGNSKAAQISEVGLSIIRILETLKKSKAVTWQASQEILENQGLEKYLLELNPKMKN
jgi:N-acetylmuramic acid 6-phosphate etherase